MAKKLTSKKIKENALIGKEARELYLKGHSLREIGEMYCKSHEFIRYQMANYKKENLTTEDLRKMIKNNYKRKEASLILAKRKNVSMEDFELCFKYNN